MARAARPVNPEDGPVQALAFDLRALREAAGNPTYRTLAKAAGYSATTLGDAAGGVRFPTLEVTLAYVGACGGDAAAWRERWQAVNRELAEQLPGTGSKRVAEIEDAAGPGGADADTDADADDADRAEPDKGPEIRVADEPEELAGAEDSPHAAEELDAASGAEQESPDDSDRARIRPGAPSSGLRTRWVSWLAVVLLSAGVAAVVPLLFPQSPAHSATQPRAASHSPSPVGCPAAPPQSPPPGGFTGLTYGPGANVRSGASTAAPVRERIPAGCTLHFSGYCLGDVVQDGTAATPDMRWFILPDHGEIASAVVHGNPPAWAPPQPCPDSVPAPSSLELALAAQDSGGGVVGVSASGVQVWIVGFAAYYRAGATGVAQWHQLAMTTGASGSFNALLRSAGVSADPSARGRIPVVAVACLGGDGATDVAASAAVLRAQPPRLEPYPLMGADLATAERVACQYPTGA